jgi:hypothetical protein
MFWLTTRMRDGAPRSPAPPPSLLQPAAAATVTRASNPITTRRIGAETYCEEGRLAYGRAARAGWHVRDEWRRAR